MVINKEDTLFNRDEKGELLPIEIFIDKLKDSVKVIPLTRGELRKLGLGLIEGGTTKDQDAELILKHCISPKYTEEEIKFIKSTIADNIVLAILEASGLDINKAKNSVDNAINDFENELKKK